MSIILATGEQAVVQLFGGEYSQGILAHFHLARAPVPASRPQGREEDGIGTTIETGIYIARPPEAVVKVILDTFGIVSGMMTTVHSYTADQVLQAT